MTAFTAEFEGDEMARDEVAWQAWWAREARTKGHVPTGPAGIVQLSPDTGDARTRYRVRGPIAGRVAATK